MTERPGKYQGGSWWSILCAMRDIERMPDGSKIAPELSHTLLVLAMHWPTIRPTQDQLAAELKVSPRQVNRRLLALESAGLIRRSSGHTGQATHYWLALSLIRSLGPEPALTPTTDQDEKEGPNGMDDPLGYL